MKRLGMEYPTEPTYRSARKAAQRIIFANSRAQQEQKDGLKTLWPRSLFFAGLETDDPI